MKALLFAFFSVSLFAGSTPSFEEALAMAKTQNKTVLVDFYSDY